MKMYEAPDFDVTVYEVEDIITLSIGGNNPNPGGDEWWD